MQFEEFFTRPLANVRFTTELELDVEEIYNLLLNKHTRLSSEHEGFDEICKRLSLCSELKSLTICRLPYHRRFALTTQQVEKFCRALQACEKIETLDLDVTSFSNLKKQDRQLIYKTLPSLPNLEEFITGYLYNEKEDDIKVLGQSLVECKSLKTLSFSMAGFDIISDEHSNELFNALSQMHLNTVSIDYLDLGQLTIGHWQTLCGALSKSGTLKTLNINHIIYSDYLYANWAAFVNSLSSINSLEELALSKAELHKLPAPEWNTLALGLSKLNLQVLYLDGNKLANLLAEDMSAFGDFLTKLKSLKTISLDRNYDQKFRALDGEELNSDDEEEEEEEEEDEDDFEIADNNFAGLMVQLTKSQTLENISMLHCLNHLEEDALYSIGTSLMSFPKLKSLSLTDSSTLDLLDVARDMFAQCYTLRHVTFIPFHSISNDSFKITCNILARIPNVESVEFGGNYYTRNLGNILPGIDFLEGFLDAPNLRYVRGLDRMAAEKFQILYGKPNSPLLLNAHPAYAKQTFYHARVIKAWYASIADFLLRGGIHTGQNTILNSILELWLPPNEKVLLDLISKGRDHLMTFDEYEMTPIKPKVSYTLYEPLIFRKRAGEPSYLTTEKKSTDIDLLTHLGDLSFPDEQETVVIQNAPSGPMLTS